MNINPSYSGSLTSPEFKEYFENSEKIARSNPDDLAKWMRELQEKGLFFAWSAQHISHSQNPSLLIDHMLTHHKDIVLHSSRGWEEFCELSGAIRPEYLPAVVSVIEKHREVRSRASKTVIDNRSVDIADFSLSERIELASSCSLEYSDSVSPRLLALFTEQEINDHRDTFDPLIAQCLSQSNEINRSYLEKVKMYLDHLRTGTECETNGTLWQCVGEKVEGECKEFVYKLRWEYDAFTRRPLHRRPLNESQQPMDLNEIEDLVDAKNSFTSANSIAPAVEIVDIDSFSEEIAQLLGYKIELGESGIYVTLPDVNTALKRWEQLRGEEKWKNLPPLSIKVSDGIASNAEFLEAFQQHDVLVSNREEYFHDMVAHAYPVFVLASANVNEPGAYERVRDAARAIQKQKEQELQAAKAKRTYSERENKLFEVIHHTLSVFADLSTATFTMVEKIGVNESFKDTENFLNSVLGSVSWRKGLQSAGIGVHEFTTEEVVAFWKQFQSH